MMEGSDNVGGEEVPSSSGPYYNNGGGGRNLRPVVAPVMNIPTTSSSSSSSTAAAASQQPIQPLTPEQRAAEINRAIQYWLDKSTIHIVPRWIAFVVLLLLFFLRVYLVQGYFIVAYGLGIFLLNNFIAFLSPLDDPSSMNGSSKDDDGPSLPVSAKDGKEFRPFTRRLPEFKFWLTSTRGVLTSIVMTLFSVFDIPVFGQYY